MDARKSTIFAFQFVQPILQTITSDTIHGFRDSFLVCKMPDCYCMQNFRALHSIVHSIWTYTCENKPLQNAFKR